MFYPPHSPTTAKNEKAGLIADPRPSTCIYNKMIEVDSGTCYWIKRVFLDVVTGTTADGQPIVGTLMTWMMCNDENFTPGGEEEITPDYRIKPLPLEEQWRRGTKEGC